MTYLIDQSGKIEDTAKDTVIAYSNDKRYAVLIPKKLKRQVQEIYRRCGLPRLFVPHLFSVGVFLTISQLKQPASVTVDVEYPGQEESLERRIQLLLNQFSGPKIDIRFSRIGNRPRVHYAAHDVFTGKKKPDFTVSLAEVVRIIKKTDGRLRACFTTLVGARPRSMNVEYQKKSKKSRRRR